MKKIILAAVIAAPLMMPVAAFAAPNAQGEITLNATAPNTCAIRSIGGTPANGALSGNTPSTAGAATGVAVLNMTNESLIDTTTAATNAVANAMTISAFCNYGGHTVQLRSANGGLTNTAPTTTVGDFNRRIAYDATLAWDAVSATVNATGTLTSGTADQDTGAALASTPAVNTTTATLTVTTIAATTNPLLAGAYADTLTVRLGTAFGL